MKDLCVLFVAVSSIFFGVCYALKIRAGKVPAFSTWLIFFFGIFPSFVTYFLSQKGDIKSGILNAVDLVYVTMVLAAIIYWGDRKINFEPFEKWFFAGVGLIVVYGVATGDMWNSNMLTQIIITLAYVPKIIKLVLAKKNEDSFFAWIPGIFNGLVALYPAVYDGNTLAVAYAVRATLCSLVTVAVMAYYEFKQES